MDTVQNTKNAETEKESKTLFAIDFCSVDDAINTLGSKKSITINDVPKGTFPKTFARNRRTSMFDLALNVCEFKRYITKFVMNEKRIPKRYRYIIGLQIIKYADEIRDCILRANDIRIDGYDIVENRSARRKLQQQAISTCNILYKQLGDLCELKIGTSPENINGIASMLLSIVKKTRAWMRSDDNRYGKELFTG